MAKQITSAADFARRINGFITWSQEAEIAPTDHQLYQYLGVKPSEYDYLCRGLRKDGTPWREGESEGREDRREAEDAAKKLVAYREDRLVQELEKSRTTSSNVIFQLKQAKNGGYQDTIQTDSQSQVTIKIDGIGGLDSFR